MLRPEGTIMTKSSDLHNIGQRITSKFLEQVLYLYGNYEDIF